MQKVMAIAATLALTASSLSSQQSCGAYVGKTVEPLSFAQAAGPFLKIPPKDEFETTAQYTARINAAAGDRIDKTIILGKQLLNKDHMIYDADKELLTIDAYIFDTWFIDVHAQLRAIKQDDKIKADRSNNLTAMIVANDSATGQYEATNGYGAKFTVMRYIRDLRSVFERPLPTGAFSLFSTAGVLATLPLHPDEARQLKSTAQVAFAVRPFAPFIISGERALDTPSSTNPMEITERFQTLFAQIDCALLLNGSKVVMAAVETR